MPDPTPKSQSAYPSVPPGYGSGDTLPPLPRGMGGRPQIDPVGPRSASESTRLPFVPPVGYLASRTAAGASAAGAIGSNPLLQALYSLSPQSSMMGGPRLYSPINISGPGLMPYPPSVK